MHRIALDKYGDATTRDTIQDGVPAIKLLKLAVRGNIESIAYGLYRLSNIPPTKYDCYAEALLRIRERTCLYGESVLVLLELADADPRNIRLAFYRRARPNLLELIEAIETKNGTYDLPLGACIPTCS